MSEVQDLDVSRFDFFKDSLFDLGMTSAIDWKFVSFQNSCTSSALIVDFPVSRTVRDKFLLVKHPDYGSVTALWTDQCVGLSSVCTHPGDFHCVS
jgi:hypothetical protein